MATAKSPHGGKTQFIHDNAHLKPKQVEEEAKKKGLKISAQYVSSVRSKAKADGAKAPAARSSAAPSSPAHTTHASRPASGGIAEFYRAVKRVGGVARAKELIEGLEAFQE